LHLGDKAAQARDFVFDEAGYLRQKADRLHLREQASRLKDEALEKAIISAS
jgi:hypothetical protein